LFGVFIFKLEEEVNTALLLLLLKRFAETAVFDSVLWMGCWLVVGVAQAVEVLVYTLWIISKLEDNRTYPPLIIFYQRSL
jgi:hypothetical protein